MFVHFNTGIGETIETQNSDSKRIERAKNFLEDYKYTKDQYDYYLEELERIKLDKVVLTKILTGMPSGNIPKRLDDKWVDLMEYSEEIADYLSGVLEDLKADLELIREAIKDLPRREQAIVVARYISGKSFHDIQKKMNCTDRTMFYVHESALKHLQIPDEWDNRK